jgi:hypothetical protein
LDVLVEGLCETLEACGRLLHRADVGLTNAWLRRGGTHHRREPAQGGRAPMGPAHVTAIVSEPKGVEAQRRVFKIAEGVFTRAGENADGCLVALGTIDRGEGPRAGQASQGSGVAAVGLDAVARLVGKQ